MMRFWNVVPRSLSGLKSLGREEISESSLTMAVPATGSWRGVK